MNTGFGVWVVVETLLAATVCHAAHLGTLVHDGYRPVAWFEPQDETKQSRINAFLAAEAEAKRLNFCKSQAYHGFEQTHVYNRAYWLKDAEPEECGLCSR
jgi:hypothetical protein